MRPRSALQPPPTESGENMRFILMGMAKKESEGAPSPKPEAFAAMQEYNEDLAKRGILLAAEGLAPTSTGTRVKFSGNERIVIDGPFTEAKELVAGFVIIKVNSKEEAIEVVKHAPFFSATGKAVVEIRKLMDIEDFGEG